MQFLLKESWVVQPDWFFNCSHPNDILIMLIGASSKGKAKQGSPH